MQLSQDISIVGYGSYIPMFRLKGEEIARVWGDLNWPIKEKSVPGKDEDTTTISIEASRNALKRAEINPQELGTVFVGTESKPYAVKPTGTIVAEAIGATPSVSTADFEFACKAGTEAMVCAMSYVSSDLTDYSLAVGVDTAQSRPGGSLDYTAGAGGAAYIFGKSSAKEIARIEGIYSFVTDTPDFWRRQGMKYPEHGYRFTGEPAYFKHITMACVELLNELKRDISEYDHVIFHQPNEAFPKKVARDLGVSMKQLKFGMLSPIIGNTYAGAVPLALTNVLDNSNAGEKILLVSYGSGSGSDAISLVVGDGIERKKNLATLTGAYIERKRYVDYAIYSRYRNLLDMGI